MDDANRGLEGERPEVLGALKSMNWEERLEQARAKRAAVLRDKAQDTAEEKKRPVVRIVDAAAMAERRGGASAPAARHAAFPLPVAEPEPEPEPLPAPQAADPEDQPTAAAVDPERDQPIGRSLAVRIASGFGVGLGIGTSLLLGVFLLGGLPDIQFARSTPSAVAAVAPAPDAPATPPLVASLAPAAPHFGASDAGETLQIPNTPVSAPLAFPLVPLVGPVVPDAAPRAALLAPEPPATAPVVALTTIAPLMLEAPATDADLMIPAAQGAPGVVTAGARVVPPGIEQAALQPEPALPRTPAPSPVPEPTPRLTVVAGLGDMILPVLSPPITRAAPERPEASVETAPEVLLAALTPPVAPPPPTGPLVPRADALSVRVNVPETVADDDVEVLAALLSETGIESRMISRVGFRVSETQVRYYHPEDAEAASILAEVFDARLRDFTNFRPVPPDGTIEVFVEGERVSPPPRRAASPTRSRPAAPDPLTQMRDRIVDRLRRGDHL